MAAPSRRFDVSLLGDVELSRTLAGLTDKMETRVVRKALRDTGNVYKRLLSAAVPVSRDPRDPHPGWWRKTLRVRAMRRAKNHVGVSVGPGTREQLAAAGAKSVVVRKAIRKRRKQIGIRDVAVATSYYPAHVEFGHTLGKEFGTRRVPPHPIMGNLLRLARVRLLETMRLSMSLAIETVLLKAGGG